MLPEFRNRDNKTEFAGCPEAVCTAKTNERAIALARWQPRQAQLAMLKQWVMQDCCRLIAIVRIGDMGKTMLITQLAQQLADIEQFEVVGWWLLRQASPFVDFLTGLICAIAPDRTLPQSLDAIMRHLLIQLRSRRCLLILDNMETVFSSKNLVGTYRSGYENCGL